MPAAGDGTSLIVTDQYPVDVQDEEMGDVQLTLSPQLKLMQVSASLGQVSTTIQIARVTQVVSPWGGQESSFGWDLTSTDRHPISGVRHFFAIIPSPEPALSVSLGVEADAVTAGGARWWGQRSKPSQQRQFDVALQPSVAAVTVLRARELYRFYRVGDEETLALRGVSLAVPGGVLLTVAGPSGSGKSTLLACLAGLDEPDGGSVYIRETRISHRPEHERSALRARHIGTLFQNANLLEHLTVRRNLELVQRIARPGHRASARPSASALHAAVGDVISIGRAGLAPVQVRVDGIVDLPQADSLFQRIGVIASAQPKAPPDNILLLPMAQWRQFYGPLAGSRPDVVKTQVHVRLRHDLPADPAAAFTAITGGPAIPRPGWPVPAWWVTTSVPLWVPLARTRCTPRSCSCSSGCPAPSWPRYSRS